MLKHNLFENRHIVELQSKEFLAFGADSVSLILTKIGEGFNSYGNPFFLITEEPFTAVNATADYPTPTDTPYPEIISDLAVTDDATAFPLITSESIKFLPEKEWKSDVFSWSGA